MAALSAITAPPLRAATPALVQCRDPDRLIVRQTTAAACEGEIVSDAEAMAVRERRARYIRRAVTAPHHPRPRIIGSGVFVSNRGDVLTNRHVVESCQAISVLQSDGRTVPARLVATSPVYDLSLLRTGERPTAIATFTGERLEAGNAVAITSFQVSTLPPRRPQTIEGHYLSQRSGGTDGILVLAAAVMPGASGGAVVNGAGAVAGLVFARNDTTRMPASFHGGAYRPPPDRTYAIPASALRRFLSAQGIPFRTARADSAAAESYTVRVNCYPNGPNSN